MSSCHDAWQKTLKILPWIVIVIGIAGILRGLSRGLETDTSTATLTAGIITWLIGALWLYKKINTRNLLPPPQHIGVAVKIKFATHYS